MSCFKFHQILTINEEFDLFEGEGEGPPGSKGALIHKFLSQLLLVRIFKFYVSNFIKISLLMKNLTFLKGREGGAPGE